MTLEVSFGARALVGANDGLDPIACAERYAAALRESLEREWPTAAISITFTDDRAPTRVRADDDATERVALDLAWVVRQMGAWA